MKKYWIECLGTALLIFFGCGTICIASKYVGIVGSALSFAIVFCLWNYLMKKFTICHLNPAITLAYYIQKKLDKKDFWLYVVFQFLGALFGSTLLVIIVLMSGEASSIIYSSIWANAWDEYSIVHISIFGAIIVELIATFILVLFHMIVYNKKSFSKFAPVLFSMVYMALIFFTFPLTGACLNPARALGPAIMYLILGNPIIIIEALIFVLVTFVGAAFASLCYKIIERNKILEGK